MSDKDDFLVKLGGKSELKKILNRLVKEQEVLRIQIEELVGESILADKEFSSDKERALWRILHRMPGQHSILFDTDCEKSPYGMHGSAKTHILTSCVWCTTEIK